MSIFSIKDKGSQLHLMDNFDQLVESQQKRVYNVCLRIMRDPQDAMDMTQETFLKAWRARSSFMGDAMVSTWLHRVAVNACLDEIRRRKKRTTVSIQELSEGGWEPADNTAGDLAALVADRAAVKAALEKLPDDHRVVLVLREIEGYSYEDIASAMHCPVGTVRSRLNRARANMMKILRDMEQNPETNVNHGKGGASR